MKKTIAFITIFAMLFCCSACNKSVNMVTEKDANEFLTDFFASYTKMNEYLKSSEIAISAFALDGEGLSSILKAVYQSGSVTYSYPMPEKVGEGIFRANVEVSAPNIEPLYDMYAIDREFLGGDIPEGFVAQSFYDNIRTGTTKNIKTIVNIAFTYSDGKWTIAPNNDLAMAIFPNIDKAN